MRCILSTGGGCKFGFSFSADTPQKFAPHVSATTLLFKVIFVMAVSIPYERTAIAREMLMKIKKIIDYI